jgi:hypothetical protein
MNNIITVIFIVGIIIVFTIYITAYIIKSPSVAKDLAPSPIDLSSPKNLLSPDEGKQILLNRSESTLSGFFYIKGGDRTGKMNNDFITIIQLGSVMSFDTSFTRHDANASSRIVVTTMNGNSQKHTEIIELPPFPLQKWTYLSILRDGRRIDVMYDNRIVASHRLSYYPVIMISPLTIGNTSVMGSALNITAHSTRLQPSQIANTLTHITNTNGQPTALSSFTLPLPSLSLSSIQAIYSPGSTDTSEVKPPKNHMKAWTSPYA